MSFFSGILDTVKNFAKDVPFIGDAISAGANLLGGSLSRNSTGDANANNAAMQERFARNSIRWRVEDAKAAGVSPLFALGAPAYSFAPSFVGDNGIANAVSNMGSDISRSIHATRTAPERVQAQMEALALERGELENQLLRSQIAKMNAQVGPPMPGNGLTEDVPLKRVIGEPGKYGDEAGNIPEVGFARTSSGGSAPVPSKDVKERIEDQLIPELLWSLRNNLMPNLPWNWSNQSMAPSKRLLPKWADSWQWSIRNQSWFPVKSSRQSFSRKFPSHFGP